MQFSDSYLMRIGASCRRNRSIDWMKSKGARVFVDDTNSWQLRQSYVSFCKSECRLSFWSYARKEHTKQERHKFLLGSTRGGSTSTAWLNHCRILSVEKIQQWNKFYWRQDRSEGGSFRFVWSLHILLTTPVSTFPVPTALSLALSSVRRLLDVGSILFWLISWLLRQIYVVAKILSTQHNMKKRRKMEKIGTYIWPK